MSSEIMEKRSLSSFYMASAPSSSFSKEIILPTERQVGFWKPESVPDYHGTEGMPLIPRSKSNTPSREEFSHSLDSMEPPYFIKDLKSKFSVDHHSAMTSLSIAPWRTVEPDSGPQPSLHGLPASLYMDGNKNGFQYENGLFSCSFSDILNRKLRLSSDAFWGKSTNYFNAQTNNTINAKFRDDESFESSEEIEAQTIGDILAGDDELLAGVIDDLECVYRLNSSDDVEEELLYSGGGMELEADDNLNRNKNSDIANGIPDKQQGVFSVPFAGERSDGEHPSRTLFVRNINSNVEDSELQTLFEEYGDIRNIYTACKHRGFVMISYYGIRSARDAMRTLQNKHLRWRKLDIHSSIPKDNPSEKDINQGTLVVQP